MLPGRLEFTAGGNINPCRFVEMSTATEGRVTEANASTDLCIGVSQEGTRNVPYGALNDGLAAIAGEPVKLWYIGELALLEVSAAVTRADRLKASAADGRGMTAGAADAAFAIALKSAGGAGEKIPVILIFDRVNT